MKNYIVKVNDHSASMGGPKAKAALSDHNATIDTWKTAASREELDTVVSVIGVGADHNNPNRVVRQATVSNPHVLKKAEHWPAVGNTPLWDGILDGIKLHEGLPDIDNTDVSVLVDITTDGADNVSGPQAKAKLAAKMDALQRTGRWTFVFRIPAGCRSYLSGLPVPAGNVLEWENSARGLEEANVKAQAATSAYFTQRSAGVRASSAFYANAAAVDVKALTELDPKEFSLYVVPGQATDKSVISDFILSKRQQYLKGAAFYQLTKTEPRVSHTKLILVRDRSTGKVYAGNEARQMIGLPTHQNARLHPGDHKNYDIFIQSESWNRHLVGGTGVIYWANKGVPFTAEDLAKFQKPVAQPAPAVVQLPAVPVTNRPTPSPIAPKPKVESETVDGKPVRFFAKRDEARVFARSTGKSPKDATQYATLLSGRVQGSNGKRWFVFL